MKKTLFFLLIFTAGTMLSAKSGKPIRIWEDVPSMKKTKTVMYMHEPDKNAGNRNAAVIICPGGSYHHLGLYNEGYKTAGWFASKGET